MSKLLPLCFLPSIRMRNQLDCYENCTSTTATTTTATTTIAKMIAIFHSAYVFDTDFCYLVLRFDEQVKHCAPIL